MALSATVSLTSVTKGANHLNLSLLIITLNASNLNNSLGSVFFCFFPFNTNPLCIITIQFYLKLEYILQ